MSHFSFISVSFGPTHLSSASDHCHILYCLGQRVANFLFFKSTPALAVIMTVAVSENPESKLTSP